MKLIVGLGNPGPTYSRTRHNVGRMVVERVAKRWSITPKKRGCSSMWGGGLVLNQPVRLALPETFMNASGTAVRCLLRRWRLESVSMLVICDDVSLPLGMIRLRPQGSEGGHLGLASILQEVGKDEIPRLRVGIRTQLPQAGETLAPFVLGRFEGSERRLLEEGLDLAVAACEVWVTEGISAAMNRFNRKIT